MARSCCHYSSSGDSPPPDRTLRPERSRSRSDQGTEPVVSVEFTDVAWKRLRCTVAVEGNTKGLSLDVRMQPGDLCSSVVVGIKPLKDNGTASVVVENEELEGHEATLVLIDANNLPVAQIATVIGGGSN